MHGSRYRSEVWFPHFPVSLRRSCDKSPSEHITFKTLLKQAWQMNWNKPFGGVMCVFFSYYIFFAYQRRLDSPQEITHWWLSPSEWTDGPEGDCHQVERQTHQLLEKHHAEVRWNPKGPSGVGWFPELLGGGLVNFFLEFSPRIFFWGEDPNLGWFMFLDGLVQPPTRMLFSKSYYMFEVGMLLMEDIRLINLDVSILATNGINYQLHLASLI